MRFSLVPGHRFSFILIGLLAILVACGRPAQVPTVTPTLPPAATPTTAAPLVTPTPTTIAPGNNLVVCLPEEPATLYWPQALTAAEAAVLHGIYENDYTTLSFRYQAQGLETIPSLANGGAQLRVVPVEAGDRVVNTQGEVVTLETGELILTADSGLITYNEGEVLMQQLVTDFIMKQRYWSDGQPVTAADSVYSFELAGDNSDPVTLHKKLRTASYQATGNLSVRWAGLPGFLDSSFQSNFWHPLPRTAWRDIPRAQLPAAEEAARLPPGDGPFVIVEWVPGRHIRLEPNSAYYRAEQGLPRLDSVTFLFEPDAREGLSRLLAGECHVLVGGPVDADLIPFLVEAQEAGLLLARMRPGSQQLQLVFDIPAAGGDGSPGWFDDVRVRQAVAMCLDREQMVASLFGDQTSVAHSYVPSLHPLYAPDGVKWSPDRRAAIQLLDEAGFSDQNGDGIREDPASGSDFRVTLELAAERVEQQVGLLIQQALLDCGIDVLITTSPLAEDTVAGADADLAAGRAFDLRLDTITTGLVPDCQRYRSQTETTVSGEVNLAEGQPGADAPRLSRWSNPGFDAACLAASNSLPGLPEFVEAHATAQRIFTEDLPALPLFAYPAITVVRPEVLHVSNDPSQVSELWNLFAIELSN